MWRRYVFCPRIPCKQSDSKGSYYEQYVAGFGVTSKVLMIITLFGIGVGSGVQPILGYCYGAKNKKRLLDTIKFSTFFGLAFFTALF